MPLTAVWIMPWATLVYFLMPLGLEDFALVPMSWGVDALIWLAQMVTVWPNAVLALPSMPSAGLAAVAAGGLWRGRWRFVGLLPIMIGCATMLMVRPPDVLIAAEGGLFAVRGNDGELLFAPDQKGQAFLREVWRRRAAGSAWDDNHDLTLLCDRFGCVYRSRGRVVAFIRDTAALAEVFRLADAVISWRAIWPDRCIGPEILIDRRSLTASGGHALWLTRDGPLRIEAVRERRGDRPWSVGR